MLFTTFLHAAFNTNEEERRRLPYFFTDWDFLPSIGGNAEHHLSVFTICSFLKPRNNFVHDVKLDSRSLAQSVNEVTFSFVPMYHSFCRKLHRNCRKYTNNCYFWCTFTTSSADVETLRRCVDMKMRL